MEAVSKVEEYINKHKKWKKLLLQLREIMLSTPPLVETIKWGIPVYTVDGKNILGLAAFKSYAGIWFFQGSFLQDKQKKLFNAQKNLTKAQRQWRFQSEEDVDKALIKAYVEEAISNHKAGKILKPAKEKPLNIPSELQKALESDRNLTDSFNKMGLTKQREFVDYITQAKRPETKELRLNKIIPMILEHKGLFDKYKK